MVIALFLLTPLGASGKLCPVSATSCEFYSCMEEKTQCGKNGYWKKMGLYYCQKFLFKENQFSAPAQKWMQASRLCLQQKAQNLDSGKLSCDQMRDQALDTHVGCYIDSGICELSVEDRNKIYWHLSSSMLYPEIWKQAIKVAQICRERDY